MRIDSSPRAEWLRARSVSFNHGKARVLDSVNLDLQPGRHYIVAGPNGAGKSTLLDLLARLKKPGTGSISLMGKPLEQYAPLQLARLIAFARQEYTMDFSFTVRETVAMGRRPYIDRWGRLSPADWQAVDQALEKMHLDDLQSRPVTALSGGEKRRSVVARAFAQTTPLLLLDEPCAGLDINHALAVMSLARETAHSGAVVVTVSHDLALAARYGDELILLKDGAIAASGPVAEVFSENVLASLYETEAEVRRDPFTDSLTVSFRQRTAL